jgi:hypothetical protein
MKIGSKIRNQGLDSVILGKIGLPRNFHSLNNIRKRLLRVPLRLQRKQEFSDQSHLRHSLLHVEGSIPARLNQYGEMLDVAALNSLSRTRPSLEIQSNGFVSHKIRHS